MDAPPRSGDRWPYNHIIVLRRSTGSFEYFYEDDSGFGLLPMPEDTLVASGLERLLDELTNRPASRAAVEAIPTVIVGAWHKDSHCAVCMEAWEVGTEAREMPCGHMYHEGCILPWLALRSTCPVCRHQMPTEEAGSEEGFTTAWRIPGGGFVVGRYTGGFNININSGGGGGAPSTSLSSSSSTGGSSSVRRRLFRNMFSCFGHPPPPTRG